jgi:hypothetical protein
MFDPVGKLYPCTVVPSQRLVERHWLESQRRQFFCLDLAGQEPKCWEKDSWDMSWHIHEIWTMYKPFLHMIFCIKYSTRRCQKQQAHFPKVIARWQHLALNLLGWWPQFLVIPGTTWYLPTRWQQGHSRSSHYFVCVEWVRVVHIMNNFHGSTKKWCRKQCLNRSL